MDHLPLKVVIPPLIRVPTPYRGWPIASDRQASEDRDSDLCFRGTGPS